ncbi:hypothetical protein BI344_16295 [Chromobacterium sphagni]|uniref:RebB like protein n=1 Tax=Chromobacterium sphagni TaxID=1903179 RepID=A0ABX3CCF3_9NEIS|nr:hypothetical protein BI344_16295 [Chromobacterium sphagni]
MSARFPRPPTAVNCQITDAAAQASNVKVLGEAPAMAVVAVNQAIAHASGILWESATSSQQQPGMAGQAAVNQGVTQIDDADSDADGQAREPAELETLIRQLKSG